MGSKSVQIRKVENGYLIKATVVKEKNNKNVEGMMNFMRAMGMYESWQEHKEEEIRRALDKMALTPFPVKEEKEIICASMSEVTSFLEKFFEHDPQDPISL